MGHCLPRLGVLAGHGEGRRKGRGLTGRAMVSAEEGARKGGAPAACSWAARWAEARGEGESRAGPREETGLGREGKERCAAGGEDLGHSG